MSRQGFRVGVISPDGEEFVRHSLDKSPGKGENVKNRIPFKFDYDETLTPNFGSVTLINITDKQRKQFKEGGEMTLQAGWLPDKPKAFNLSANIINTRVYRTENGATTETVITFSDTLKAYHTHNVSRYWPKKSKVGDVLRDLIEEEVGAKDRIGHFECTSSKRYRRGKSFYLPVKQAIEQVTSDAGVKCFFYNKKAYVMPINKTLSSGVTIRKKDKLSKPFKKRGTHEEITIPAEPRIKPSHSINISLEDVSGRFKVYSGIRTSKDGRRFHDKLKLKRV